jgi:hypothetical protein
MTNRRSIVVYMSCFGDVAFTDCMSRKDAQSITAYLRNHPVAYPLYIINVRLK